MTSYPFILYLMYKFSYLKNRQYANLVVRNIHRVGSSNPEAARALSELVLKENRDALVEFSSFRVP